MHSLPLYQRVADHYRRAIQNGVLAHGDRVPSIRALMRLHQVSLSTALQACRELESEGLLEARARSGYFVRKSRRVAIPPVRDPDFARLPDRASYVGIHDRVSAFVARSEQFPEAVNFSIGAAAPEAYPLEMLKQSMMRALRQQPQVLVRPAPALGHPAFRAVLARRALAQGIHAGADEIIVTHGCIEALNLALRTVAGPGDTIAIESPVYFGLLQILESLGMQALEIPTSPQHGISIEALDLAFQAYPGIKAVVVVPNLQNPLGSVMPDAQKARLVQLCEHQGVPLIEDDTYGLLTNSAVPLRALKAWDQTGNVIFCTSLHKTVAPGMRLGWMMGGRWQARAAMLKYVQSRPNEPLAQIAMADFMASHAYDRHLLRLRQLLKQQREQMAEAVARHFPEGTRLTVPDGGLLLWVELPDQRSSQQVFEQALAQGVRVIPGSMFSNTSRYNHFIRISCGEPFTPRTEQALRTLAALVAQDHAGAHGGPRVTSN